MFHYKLIIGVNGTLPPPFRKQAKRNSYCLIYHLQLFLLFIIYGFAIKQKAEYDFD